MTNFACEKCGMEIIEDDAGKRLIFCEHYKPESDKLIQSSYIPKERNVEERKEKQKEK